MVMELSLDDFCSLLRADPDLRRLGEYKVVAGEGQTIFPIDMDFEGRSVQLGGGDFTDGFVAFAGTKAESVDLGTSKFVDLYFDDLDAERLLLSAARASRLYFDQARLKECHFDDFEAPEVYFDDAVIDTIEGGRLRAGIIHLERLNCPGFSLDQLATNTHRLLDCEGAAITPSGSHLRAEKESDSGSEILLITPNEFLRYLVQDPDLSRLGEYKVELELGEDTRGELHLNSEFDDKTLSFGNGDFSSFKLFLGDSKASLVDFSESKFDDVDFQYAEFRDCFLAGGSFSEIRFGNARITNVFGEDSSTKAVYLDSLSAHQFNVNEIKAKEFRMGDAHVDEMYFSRGEGIEIMDCERAELGLLNLHEGQMREFHFGQSVVQKALINKAHLRGLYIEGLKADKLYIGNDGLNEIGKLEFSQITGIKEINIDKAFHERDGRVVIQDVEGYFSPLELSEGDRPQNHELDLNEALERTREIRRPDGQEGGISGEGRL